MRQTKRCVAQFTFYDRTGIRAFLEKQAEKGWLLEKISPLGWRFRRIEPKHIHFAVTYFSDASVFDPEPTEDQRIFQDFCEHTGWKLAAANGPLQIFCNEGEDPLPIETDPRLEVRNIHAAAKKNFLPSYYLLLAVCVMNIALLVGQLATFPLTYLSQNSTIFSWLCFLVLLIMCLQEIGGYFLWYRKARIAAEETGSFVETRGHRNFQLTMSAIVTAALFWLVSTMERKFAAVLIVSLVDTFGMMLAVLGIREILRVMKAPRSTNRTITILACVVLSVLSTAITTFGTVQLVQSDIWKEETVETYVVGDVHMEIYHDDLPLKVEDLMDLDYDRYSYEKHEQNSLLISTLEAAQRSHVFEDHPEISYTVYDIHLPLLYDVCMDELLSEYDHWTSMDAEGNLVSDEYREEDPSPWGAEHVYRLYSVNDAYNWYLLCYGNRIVKIHFDWEPTAEQMAIVGEILGN